MYTGGRRIPIRIGEKPAYKQAERRLGPAVPAAAVPAGGAARGCPRGRGGAAAAGGRCGLIITPPSRLSGQAAGSGGGAGDKPFPSRWRGG